MANFKLYYTFYADEIEEIKDMNIDTYVVDYEYIVSLNIQDIIEYEFELRYGKKYQPLEWFLEPDAKKFVMNLEDKWMMNKIDEIALQQDFNFRDWLKDKYQSDALLDWITEINE